MISSKPDFIYKLKTILSSSIFMKCLFRMFILIGSTIHQWSHPVLEFPVSSSRGWDGWMASQIQQTWTCVNSRKQWGIGKPGMLQPLGSWRVQHDLATEQQQVFWIEIQFFLTDMRLLKLSIYYWVSFGNLCLLCIELFDLKMYINLYKSTYVEVLIWNYKLQM